MLARKYFKIVSVLMFSNGKRINSSIQNQTITPSHDIIEIILGIPHINPEKSTVNPEVGSFYPLYTSSRAGLDYSQA